MLFRTFAETCTSHSEEHRRLLLFVCLNLMRQKGESLLAFEQQAAVHATVSFPFCPRLCAFHVLCMLSGFTPLKPLTHFLSWKGVQCATETLLKTWGSVSSNIFFSQACARVIGTWSRPIRGKKPYLSPPPPPALNPYMLCPHCKHMNAVCSSFPTCVHVLHLKPSREIFLHIQTCKSLYIIPSPLLIGISRQTWNTHWHQRLKLLDSLMVRKHMYL